MNVHIEEFSVNDIEFKVNLINDNKNNTYLHYDLPLTIEGTKKWYDNISKSENRYDAVVYNNNQKVGIIGLLNIKNSEAEYYITMNSRGNGIAEKGTEELIKIAKEKLKLHKIYLFTESNNIIAQIFFEKVGFTNKQKISGRDFFNRSDRFYYDMQL